MEDIKLFVNILASLASLIAIVGVLVGWYKSTRRALEIDKVVIQQKQDGSTYILVVRNRKNYPVEIKTTNCYRRKLYNIEKRPNQKPEFSELLNLNEDNVFLDKTTFTIGSRGNTDIRINGLRIEGDISGLLFSINTSHGYHEIWCKNILILDIGKADVYELEYRKEYHSKFKAKSFYYWAVLKSWFKK